MRKFLFCSLLFSTVLLHAQTRTNGQGVTMEANNATSTVLPASAPAVTDVNAGFSARRITTGVIAPKLLTSPNIVVATTDFATDDLSTQKAIVSFKVDAEGLPHHVEIKKSVNPEIDARVLAAVSSWRFTPATLDDQPVPLDMNLVVQFQAAR